MTLGQGHDTPLGQVQQVCEISSSNKAVMSWTLILGTSKCALWPWTCMTLSHDHDTPLGHGQQVSEILSRSNMAVSSYGPDTDFG